MAYTKYLVKPADILDYDKHTYLPVRVLLRPNSFDVLELDTPTGLAYIDLTFSRDLVIKEIKNIEEISKIFLLDKWVTENKCTK